VNELKMNLGMHWVKWQDIDPGIHGLNEDLCKIKEFRLQLNILNIIWYSDKKAKYIITLYL